MSGCKVSVCYMFFSFSFSAHSIESQIDAVIGDLNDLLEKAQEELEVEQSDLNKFKMLKQSLPDEVICFWICVNEW